MLSKLLNLFANDDWRHKSAVLLVVSELSSFISGSHLQTALQLIQQGSVHLHPKVRHAAAETLRYVAFDLKPKYRQEFFEQTLPILLSSLDDKAERVSSHWLACLTSFMGTFQDELEPHIDSIIQKI